MQQQDRERRKQVFAFGFGIFELYGIDPSFEELTPCLFHWFGTSMCNYARLVGWLEGANSNQFSFERPADQASAHQVKSYCDAYVRSVYELSEVVVWRNKVFAHFALTDPRLGDNEATLNMSTMSPVTYARDRLRVGELIHSGSDGDATLPPWSITEVYEAISARYWP